MRETEPALADPIIFEFLPGVGERQEPARLRLLVDFEQRPHGFRCWRACSLLLIDLKNVERVFSALALQLREVELVCVSVVT